MLDDEDDNELPPEAFEWLIPPKEERQRGLSNTERTRKKRRLEQLIADADIYNALVANYGRDVLDRLIEEGITARAFVCAVMLIGEDLDLWFEATGERLVFRNLGAAERLGLECWVWETYDRSGRWGPPDPQGGKKGARNPDRWKLKKSTNHDRPWPTSFSPLARWIAHGTVLDLRHSEQAPRDWAPSRWFTWRPPRWLQGAKPPWLISISRALNQERALIRAQFATETSLGEWRQTSDGWQEDTSSEPITERNHPKPQGFWKVRKEPLSQRLVWKDRAWERCDDEPPPESVLLQTHTALNPFPGAWALRHVETPANNLSADRKRLARLRRLWRERLPDDDDLDRLATSAAMEAAA